MCALKRASSFFLLLLALCSFSAWSQESGSGTPLPAPESSGSSLEASSIEGIPDLPTMNAPQIDPQLPLEERQAIMLEAWTAWYTQVKDSWTKAKSSYENLDTKRLDQIAIYKKKVDDLLAENKRLKLHKWAYGFGGFAAGLLTGRASAY